MNFELNKKSISAIAVYGIALFLFIFLFFVIPFPKTSSSIIAFVFSVISIIASAGISAFAFAGKEEINSKVYGFPVFRVGIIYALAQLALCVIVCFISVFVFFPEWIVLVVSVVFMCLAAVGVIATDITRDAVEAIEAETKAQTKAIRNFRIDASGIAYMYEGDANVKKELEKLSEMFKYSDPVSNEETLPYEKALFGALDDLRASLKFDSDEDLLKKITEIRNMLSERNRICKMSK